MWKQARESGVSLAELLVVLAITVVLAAILMPALNSPHHAGEGGSPEAGLDPYVVAAEGYAASNSRDRNERRTDRERDEPAVDDMPAPEAAVEVMPAFHINEVETLERDGLKKIRTTDISYTLP